MPALLEDMKLLYRLSLILDHAELSPFLVTKDFDKFDNRVVKSSTGPCQGRVDQNNVLELSGDAFIYHQRVALLPQKEQKGQKFLQGASAPGQYDEGVRVLHHYRHPLVNVVDAFLIPPVMAETTRYSFDIG